MNCRAFIMYSTRMVAPVAALGCVLAVMAAPSMAQTGMTVHDRLHRQNTRIQAGLKNHDLSKYRAQTLHARDRSIHHAAMVDRSHDHGKLTAAQHARMEHRLNNTSKAIYDRKHNIK